MKTTLIVLTLNEIEGVKSIMPRIDRNICDEIIVVDGGSSDGTIEYLTSNGFKVIGQREKGRGNAFRVGMENAKGDILVFFSPDGNEVPDDIPKLISKIKEGYDMVIASRFSKQSESHDATLIRRFGNWYFTKLVNIFWKANVTDAVNGFRAIKKKCMQKLDLKAIYFEIELEMTIKSAKKGYKITEIPTIEPQRIGGKGKLSTIRDGYIYMKLVIKELLYN